MIEIYTKHSIFDDEKINEWNNPRIIIIKENESNGRFLYRKGSYKLFSFKGNRERLIHIFDDFTGGQF